MKVGIPRALLYYQYYPMWKTFFEELGALVLVSGPTSKATLAAGIERALLPAARSRATTIRSEIVAEFDHRRLCRDLEQLYEELLARARR